MGLGIGIAFTSASMYLGEISLIRLRGTILTSLTVVTNFSFTLPVFFAAIMPFQLFIVASAAPPVMFLLLAYFLPESPLWLMKKGRKNEATKVMLSLRGMYFEYLISFRLKHISMIDRLGTTTKKKFIS